MRNSNISQHAASIQQFLKYKQSQVSLGSTIKSTRLQRQQQERRIQEIKQLRLKNQLKESELAAYEKEYAKLQEQARDAIFQLKNEQDEVEKELQKVKKQKKMQQDYMRDSGTSERFDDLQEQIDMCKADRREREQKNKRQLEEAEKVLNQEKIVVKNLGIKAQQEEKAYVQSGNKQIILQKKPDIENLRNQIQQIKNYNATMIKEQANELKKFRKDAEDMKKSLKELLQNEDDKVKNWIKKCDAVIDGKKQFKDIIPEWFYNEAAPSQSIDQLYEHYQRQLQTIGQLYPANLLIILQEMGLLDPLRLKQQQVVIRNSLDKMPVADMEEEIKKIELEIANYAKESENLDGDIELFQNKIDQYDKDITNLRQSMEQKRKS